jgi:APA family basic amino acid/polyamine antiporter
MTTYARRLGLFSATMAVVGGIVGGGIFRTPAAVAERVGTPELALGAWIVGGAVALVGAFCFGELGYRRPRAGGGYVYLREAWGALPAFLYGWALLLVIATGAIAAVAVTFADYALALTGLPSALTAPVAVGAIVLLAAINYVGVAPGAITVNILTVLKLVALAAVIVVGLALAVPTGIYAPEPPAAPERHWLLTLGAALVPILFTYGGWQQTNFIAEEIVEPERTLPRALVLGVLIVVAVYLLANLAYLRALGPAGLAHSTAPAADTMRGLLGPAGGTFIAAGIAVSTLGFLDLVILVTPRVLQAMAADGVFFPSLARLHPVYRTPTRAILLESGWAIVLTLTGTFGQLVDYVSFGDWIFFGLTVAGLYRLRARDARTGTPAPPRGVRVPGYPWTPALFVAAAALVVTSAVLGNPRNAAIGTALLLLGIPVYLWWRRPPWITGEATVPGPDQAPRP